MSRNKATGTRWVAALRSGDYKQGRKLLRTGDEYCVLGVLCDLYRRDVGANLWGDPGTDNRRTFDGAIGILPPSVQRWAGLRDRYPQWTINIPLRGDKHDGSLTTLNDAGRTFATLANIIEAGDEA